MVKIGRESGYLSLEAGAAGEASDDEDGRLCDKAGAPSTLARASMHARTHTDRKDTHARRPEEEDSVCVGKQDPLLESPVMHEDKQDQEQYVYVQTLMHIWVHVHLQRESARERASERDQHTHNIWTRHKQKYVEHLTHICAYTYIHTLALSHTHTNAHTHEARASRRRACACTSRLRTASL